MPDPIAEKYAGKVTPEHIQSMHAIGFAVSALEFHRKQYEKLLESRRYMENIGFIVDPTLARDMMASKNVERTIKLVKAAMAFLDAAVPVYAEIRKEEADASGT